MKIRRKTRKWNPSAVLLRRLVHGRSCAYALLLMRDAAHAFRHQHAPKYGEMVNAQFSPHGARRVPPPQAPAATLSMMNASFVGCSVGIKPQVSGERWGLW